MKTRKFLLAVAGSSLLLTSPLFAQKATTPPVPPKTTATTPAVPAAAPAATAVTPNGPAGIAADVNGEKIPLVDLTRMVDEIKDSDPAFKADTPAVKKALIDIRAQVLDDMITSRVLTQEARRQKIAIPQADIDKEFASQIADLKQAFKTDAEFQNWLKAENKTQDDLKKTVSDALAVRELKLRLTSDVIVTNDDIAKFYRENMDTFTAPEAVKARHILLAINPNSPKEEKERVKKRAIALIGQLNKGADFATMAKNNSDDPLTNSRGGLMQIFTRNQISKPIEDAAFGAQVGKIVGPVESPVGIHIIKVEQKLAAEVVPLSEAQKNPRLKAYLLEQKRQQRIQESTAKLKAAATIKRYV